MTKITKQKEKQETKRNEIKMTVIFVCPWIKVNDATLTTLDSLVTSEMRMPKSDASYCLIIFSSVYFIHFYV